MQRLIHCWNRICRSARRRIAHLRFGPLTEEVTATAGHGVPSEILYRNKKGVVVGYWAYGDFDPAYPYRGD